MEQTINFKRLTIFTMVLIFSLSILAILPQVNAAITSVEGDDWAEVDMHWFTKTRHGGAGGFRASIGIDPTTGPGQNGWFPGGWKWISGTTYHFTVEYDSITNVADLYVTGQNSDNPLCSYSVGTTSGGIGINARTAPDIGMSTTIENIKLNGISVTPDDSVTAISIAGESAVRHLLIEGADLTSDFTLEGDFTFVYGSSTSDERPSMVINFGPVTACEPDIPVNAGYDPDATCSNGARWRNFKFNHNGWDLAVGSNIGDAGSVGIDWSHYDISISNNYYFVPDGPNIFTYTYDAGTGLQTIEAIIDGGTFSQTHNNGNLGSLDYLQFDVVGRNGQTVEFNNVMLTVGSTTYSLCDYEAGGWLTWYIDSLDFSGGFSITGEVWLTGQAAGQEHSKINICVGSTCTPICRNVEDNIEYCTIQGAIDAATTTNGETIEIYAGTHIEQVEVYKSLTLYGQGIGTTVIQSPDNLIDYFTTSNNNFPIMYIHNVDGVVLHDLTVDGAGKGNANYRFVGIGIYEAGATIQDVEVIGVRDTPFSGAQHGVAIYGWSDATTIAHDVVIENCLVYDYQKTGIALGGSDLTVDVNNCEVTGVGPTTVTAQNGIQVSHGSMGSITENLVTGCSYTGSGWAASGILPYLSGGVLDISDNVISENQANIYLCSCSADISRNMISASAVGTGQTYFYGIIGDPGDPPLIPDASPVDDGTPPTDRITYTVTCSDNDLTGDGSIGGVGIGVYAGMYGNYDIVFSATYNTVNNWGTGFELYEYAPGLLTTADINYNNIVGNGYGIYNWLTTTYDATCNWWGTSDGPNMGGDITAGPLILCPWLDDAYPFGDCIGGIICENLNTGEKYCCIQCAIDDVDTLNGHTIYVYPGTHVEQVEIYKSITLTGAGMGTTIIQSPDTLIDSFPTGSNNNFPVIYIHDIEGVEIKDLTVDGAGKGNANYRFVGIGIYEAGATIQDVEVIGVRDTPFSGAQHGVAIYGWSDATTIAHDVVIENCLVYDYQKTGIALGGSDLTVDVNNCEVTGVGPTTVTAQNGIQVSSGAIGSIVQNIVSGCSYTGGYWAASGILPYAAGGVLDISDNQLIENQANIYLISCSADITGNFITATSAGIGLTNFYGIIGDPGDPPIIPDAYPIDEGSLPLDRATYVITCTGNQLSSDGSTDSVGIGVYAGLAGTYDIEFSATYNDVSNWGIGFELYEYAPNELIQADINYNNIVGNGYGIYNWLTTTFDATCNWYGQVSGPSHADNPLGTGDTISDYLTFLPWLDAPSPNGDCIGGLCADPVYVDNDYTTSTPGYNIDHFATLQPALDRVCEGGTVYVYNGFYHHYKEFEVNTNGITIIGEGIPPYDIHVNSAAKLERPLHILADGVTVNYLVFDPSLDGAVVVDGSNVIIQHNKFLRNCITDNIGLVNQGDLVDARFNWWGRVDGPSGGIGDSVTGRVADGYGVDLFGDVRFDPWAGIDALISMPPDGFTVELGESILFDASDSFATYLDGSSNIFEASWDFDDDSYHIGEQVNHYFDSVGSYDVRLRLEAVDLQLHYNFMYDWDYVTVHVVEPGTPLTVSADGESFGGYETIVGEPVQLFGEAYGGSGDYQFIWNFGDNTGHGTDQNPVHVYDSAGTYMVTLTVISGDEMVSDSTEVVVYDVDELVVRLDDSSAVANVEIMFSASVSGGQSPYEFVWDFGDGSTSTDAYPMHTFSSVGEYQVSVTITDAMGKTRMDSAVIVVEEGKSQIEPCEIVSVSGGFGMKVLIAAGNFPVDWQISVDGPVFIGGEIDDRFDADRTEMVKLPFTLGFGRVEITVTANHITEQYSAFLFGPFFFSIEEL